MPVNHRGPNIPDGPDPAAQRLRVKLTAHVAAQVRAIQDASTDTRANTNRAIVTAGALVMEAAAARGLDTFPAVLAVLEDAAAVQAIRDGAPAQVAAGAPS